MSIKLRFTLPALALALFSCHAATAQAPAGAPAGSTGTCKDGTYTTNPTKSGACSGHKGVAAFYGSAAPAKTTAAAKPAPAPAAPATKAAAAPAPAPSGAAPAGATFVCKDGSYSMNATKSGACSGHKGVAGPVGTAAAPAPKPAATPAPAPAAAPAAAPAPKPAPAAAPAAPAPAAKTMPTPAAAPAAGGGPGMVWVNTASKVYHCPTDRYYGKTKAGKYLSESAAVAEGDKADAGKKCF